ncbi:MAG TPA: thioether cross-link-forming SCIFF peptide maturase, partial [Syntrophomonas sp.]|nr:thioether cross-link-forming SCIFF peptide maturase [Syntrophomonas sp.]
MYHLVSYDFNANIHLYRWNELNILLDVNSGAIHLLDELAYDFITCLMKNQGDFYLAVEECSLRYPSSEIMEVANEILAAYEAGEIFTPEEDLTLDLSILPIKALCLNVAHAC